MRSSRGRTALGAALEEARRLRRLASHARVVDARGEPAAQKNQEGSAKGGLGAAAWREARRLRCLASKGRLRAGSAVQWKARRLRRLTRLTSGRCADGTGRVWQRCARSALRAKAVRITNRKSPFNGPRPAAAGARDQGAQRVGGRPWSSVKYVVAHRRACIPTRRPRLVGLRKATTRAAACERTRDNRRKARTYVGSG